MTDAARDKLKHAGRPQQQKFHSDEAEAHLLIIGEGRDSRSSDITQEKMS
jgi:hypothetical protein